MKKEIRSQILNLAASIFEDKEFIIVLKYLNEGKLNALRIFLSEKKEYLEAIFHLHGEEILKTQIELLDSLEDVVLDTYLETIRQ